MSMKGLLPAILFACSIAAQAPVAGDINFYGLRRVTPERILSVTRLKTGDPLPPSKGEIEDRISDVPGVILARVEAICCEGRAATVFVGIEEQGAPHASFRSPPAGEAVLPETLTGTYQEFLAAAQHAASLGRSAEDLTAGHSLMADPAARQLQQQFLSFAADNVDLLRSVLRDGAVPEQRAIAATVIGYAPDKTAVVNDLQFALQDPDEAVRANAIRSLTAFAVLAAKQPAIRLQVSPTWFVELLNSVVLSDRTESTRALLTLTDRGGAPVLEQIRERAIPALSDMARWKTPRYALPPFVLLGRAARLTEDEIQRSWEKGDREAVIGRAGGSGPRRR